MQKIYMKRGCECGICSHITEDECIGSECICCNNFHVRSGAQK